MSGGTVMITVGRHQLAATVFGEGTPVVVIEPSSRSVTRFHC